MNEWRGRGGLTADLKMEEVSGLTKASFTVAINGTRYDSRSRQQVVKTTFVSCEAWGTVAEALYQSGVGKGCEVLVEGELTQFKREGEERAHTRIAAYRVSVVRMTRAAQDRPQGSQQPVGNDNPWGGQ